MKSPTVLMSNKGTNKCYMWNSSPIARPIGPPSRPPIVVVVPAMSPPLRLSLMGTRRFSSSHTCATKDKTCIALDIVVYLVEVEFFIV